MVRRIRSCVWVAVSACLLTNSITMNSEAAMNYKPDANAPRSAIPNEYRWNLDPIFKSDGEWNSAYAQVKKLLIELKDRRDGVKSAADLKSFIDSYLDMQKIMDRVGLYANLKAVEDNDVDKYQEMRQRSIDLGQQIQPTFIFERLLRMEDKEADSLIASKELEIYRPYINELRRRRAHLLSQEAEKIMGLAGDTLWASSAVTSDIELIFKAAMKNIELPTIKDESGNDVQMTLANYGLLRSSKNRDVRRNAVAGIFSSLRQHQDILAAALGGEFRRDVMFAKARKYDRTIDAYLDADDISPKVVDTLIEAVNKNLGPLHRYVELRKKIMGLKDLHIYDLYTPLAPEAERVIPYIEGKEDVINALAPLGEEYVSVLRKAIEPGSGWVDAYPNKGKEDGAFCDHAWGIHPFIKHNYMDRVDDVSTLAHEFGHAMHGYLNMNAQPYHLAGYSTFTAEIASTIDETLLSKYLLNKYKDDDAMRIYLLAERLELIRTTIYRQTLFAEFEKLIHEKVEEGTPITADLLNKSYLALIKKYYGPGLTLGENDEIEWAYIPHFYYKYYVFSYATGLSSGIALAENILKEGAPARDRFLAMLKEPASEKPLEILKRAGLDLTKPDAIKAATDLMDETMREMEKIISKGKK